MTHPTKNPATPTGSKDPNQEAADLLGKFAGTPKSAVPAHASHEAVSAATGESAPKYATPGARSIDPANDKSRAEAWDAAGSRSPGSLPAVQTSGDCCGTKSATPGVASSDPASDKRRAEAWDAAGSRSPGSLPAVQPSGECCGGKSATPGEGHQAHAHPQVTSPSSDRGSSRDLGTPSQGKGPRQAKADEIRSSRAQAAGSGASRTGGTSRSPLVRAESGGRPASEPSPSRTPDRLSPQDPARFGLDDPVQPNRPAPSQPSRIVEPAIGAADASGDGE